MYLSVRDVLALPPLREIRLVAGASGLDRQVILVSVLEVPLGHRRWTRGGELFMSSLYALREEGPETHAEVIHLLHQANAAALFLHPGLTGHQHLPVMMEAADRCGIPLALIPEDMPYSVVTDAIVGGLLGRQSALLERSAAINRELIQVMLGGGDLSDICRTVARRTRRPVAVLDANGADVLAHSGQASQSRKMLPDLLEARAPFDLDAASIVPIPAALKMGGPGHVYTTTVETSEGPVVQVAVPVVVGGDVGAYLVTWDVHGPLVELDFAILAHASTAVGLEVLKRRAVVEAERRVQQDFYGVALTGGLTSLSEAEHRARLAGVELAPSYVVALLRWGQALPGDASREISRWQGSVAVLADGALAIILPVPPHLEEPVSEAEQLMHRVSNLVSGVESGVPVGLSRVVRGILGLPAALAEARVALSVAERLGPDGGPMRHDRLGVFQLLGELPGAHLLRDYTQDSLGYLLALRNGADLIHTLEVYLDAGGSHRAAAKRLCLHPNTVKYRIEKIRGVLGDAALDDPIQRLGLHVALKARRLVTWPDAHAE